MKHPTSLVSLRLSPLTWLARFVLVALILATASGCVIVPQNRRARLADPMMSLSDSSLEAHRKQKLYTTREGAAGGEGRTAGGGCGCQ